MCAKTTSEIVCELAIDYTFTESEHQQLYHSFSAVTANPYHEYERFKEQIQALVEHAAIPTAFTDFCAAQQDIDRNEQPVIFIKNCPIDKTLPVFDFEKPLKQQYQFKETFIAEAFLMVYATLMKIPLISYKSVDGARFSDIYPQKPLQLIPNGAYLGPLYLHKELTDHSVTPDYVNILSLRNYSGNQVYTTFVPNQDALQLLDEHVLTELRKKQFCTLYSSQLHPQETDERYAILHGDTHLRYIEKYTRGVCQQAQVAVERLNDALHSVKKRVLMMPKDFVSIYNKASLHGKEVHKVIDEEQLKTRWLIKTLNVDNLEAYEQHFVKGQYGVINDGRDILNISSKLKRGCEVPSYS